MLKLGRETSAAPFALQVSPLPPQLQPHVEHFGATGSGTATCGSCLLQPALLEEDEEEELSSSEALELLEDDDEEPESEEELLLLESLLNDDSLLSEESLEELPSRFENATSDSKIRRRSSEAFASLC
jgi:hypothetical protein